MWAEKARSWRKNGKRGVSPIIATILLVAITVVLAAVLYILISGLTNGPGNTPIGTAFAWGPASTITGPASAGCNTAGDNCYSLQIGSAGSGIETSDVAFALHTSTGAAGAFTTPGTVTLVSVSGTAIDTWTASSNTWAPVTPGAPSNLPLSSGETLVVDNGATSLAGYTVLAVGQSHFQGTVASQALT